MSKGNSLTEKEMSAIMEVCLNYINSDIKKTYVSKVEALVYNNKTLSESKEGDEGYEEIKKSVDSAKEDLLNFTHGLIFELNLISLAKRLVRTKGSKMYNKKIQTLRPVFKRIVTTTDLQHRIMNIKSISVPSRVDMKEEDIVQVPEADLQFDKINSDLKIKSNINI